MVSELLDRGTAETYASWFRALADPSRVQIVEYLARQGRPLTVGEIVTAAGLAQSTVSQHLKVLKDAGLIVGEIEGLRICYCADRERLAELHDLVGGILDEAVEPTDEGHRECD